MAKKDFYILNVFGKKPYTNAKAAGRDFSIPFLDKYSEISDEQVVDFYDALSASYGFSKDNLLLITDRLSLEVAALFGDDKTEYIYSILLLYLSLETSMYSDKLNEESISKFVDYYLVFDANSVPGLVMNFSDYLFINSGIKVKLPKDTAGVFRNKSGRGKNGWDVRAEVVDEDYSGYVHLSVSYTANFENANNIIYAGDKLTQMLILPIVQCEDVEVDKFEFEKLHKKSERADKGFGSSNEKH